MGPRFRGDDSESFGKSSSAYSGRAEGEPVLHQQRDVVAGLQPQRAEQLRALVRERVKLAIGDRLAGAGHLIGDLVGLGARVDGGVSHWRFLGSPMLRRPRES